MVETWKNKITFSLREFFLGIWIMIIFQGDFTWFDWIMVPIFILMYWYEWKYSREEELQVTVKRCECDD